MKKQGYKTLAFYLNICYSIFDMFLENFLFQEQKN